MLYLHLLQMRNRDGLESENTVILKLSEVRSEVSHMIELGSSEVELIFLETIRTKFP